MTLEEKVALLHGNFAYGEYEGNVPGLARLGIPALRLNDGPQGFRTRPPLPSGTSTAWPSGLTVTPLFLPSSP